MNKKGVMPDGEYWLEVFGIIFALCLIVAIIWGMVNGN